MLHNDDNNIIIIRCAGKQRAYIMFSVRFSERKVCTLYTFVPLLLRNGICAEKKINVVALIGLQGSVRQCVPVEVFFPVCLSRAQSIEFIM